MYCRSCGARNEEDAAFCKGCGKPMEGPAGKPPEAGPAPAPERMYEFQREWDDRCEEECTTKGQYSWIWGAIVVLIGLGIIIEFGIKNVEGVPDWVQDVDIWWMIPVLFGVLIILVGLEAVSRSGRYRK